MLSLNHNTLVQSQAGDEIYGTDAGKPSKDTQCHSSVDFPSNETSLSWVAYSLCYLYHVKIIYSFST
jgi:hypothetical protein